MDYQKIRDLCAEKGISIPQLAEKIGVSKSFYISLKNETLNVSTLEKIAGVLDVPIGYFFHDEKDVVILPRDLVKKLVKRSSEFVKIIAEQNEKLLGVQKLSSKARIAQLEVIIKLNKHNSTLYKALMDEKEYLDMESSLKMLRELMDISDGTAISPQELNEFYNDITKIHTMLSKEFLRQLRSIEL